MHVEPQLQQLTAGNEVRLDISARGFWQAGQIAFLDVRVFNPTAKRNANLELSKAYEINKKEKKKHITKAFSRSSIDVSHFW